MPSADIARDGREWPVSISVCTYNRHRLLRQPTLFYDDTSRAQV